MHTLVAILLRLYPKQFRERHGAGLLATFDDLWREDPGLPLAARTIADLLRTSLAERFTPHPQPIAGYKGDSFMTNVAQDVRFAVRLLLRAPGFSVAAIVTLALAIGANSALYSVIDAVLWKGLPYPHAGRLVFINEALPNAPFLNASWPDFQDWRAQNQVFSAMAIFQGDRLPFATPEGSKSLIAGFVSPSFFPMLGAKTVLGRTLGPGDDHPGAPPTVLLPYRFWRNQLKADPQIIGKLLPLAGGATVVGVLDPDFRFEPFNFDVYLPIGPRAASPEFVNRGNHPGLIALAALAPGISLARARADMHAIMDRLSRAYPESNKNEAAVLTPISERLIGHFRAELFILLGAVGFVLLIACANVAHLMLARAAARRREFAIRAAIGAGRARLARQLFVESSLLALAGGAAGLLLAHFLLPPLLALYPGEIPGLKDVHLDPVVVLTTVAVCLAAAALFGLAPMLQASRAGFHAAADRSGGRFRASLLVAEIATAIVLTIGGALLLRSLFAVLHVDPGFRPAHLLALDIVHSGAPGPAKLQFFSSAVERIAHQPGVESVSAVMCPPLAGSCWTSPYVAAGRPAPPAMQRPWTAVNMILPGYFETMGTRLTVGRLFTAHDDGRSGYVAIVNQALAHRLWPHASPLGQRIDVTYATGEFLQIVGVVENLKQFSLDAPAMEEVFVPAAQMPVNFMTIVVRTSQNPAALTRAVTAVINDLDRGQPISHIAPMTDSIAGSVSRRKFAAVLLGAFSALALLLAIVGVAGVMAYSVAQRTREFGIRLAMGAQPREVLRLVLAGGLRIALLGTAIGLAAAYALTRLLAGMLFDVKPRDPLTFAAVAGLLLLAALAACALPARRAARVHPSTALRYD